MLLLEGKSDDQEHTELVLGLVAPVGTDLETVIQLLEAALRSVRYRAFRIHLSKSMKDLVGEPWSLLLDTGPYDERINSHMKAGNKFRERSGQNNAMALMALAAIGRERLDHQSEERRAYILRSLKREEEVVTLRRLYGPSFFLIAAYSSRADRERRLAMEISSSRHAFQADKFASAAKELMRRDEDESEEPFGQRVADTFALADLSVNIGDPVSAEREITRFVELLFGHPFHTPTPDEQGMFLARSSAVRSAAPSRQVGAALCATDGSVVSLGTNEVPKAGGGQYWAGDEGDKRDFRLGHDSSDRLKRSLLGDILRRLRDAEWLRPEYAAGDLTARVEECLDGAGAVMKGAEFKRTIDFVRAVHAEMSALLDAAKRGAATQGCVLYTTTFPCHDCAKHIVGAGVSRVVYVEPYPKSLIQDLCSDSIVFDEVGCDGIKVNVDQFVGITPMRYLELFGKANKQRKDHLGDTVKWVASEAEPYLPQGFFQESRVRLDEIKAVEAFLDLLISEGLWEGPE